LKILIFNQFDPFIALSTPSKIHVVDSVNFKTIYEKQVDGLNGQGEDQILKLGHMLNDEKSPYGQPMNFKLIYSTLEELEDNNIQVFNQVSFYWDNEL